MAVANTPSWLNAPNFLDFIKSGADTGLTQSRIAQAANEAAGRLNLGYAELGSRERSRSGELEAHRQSAADALKERQMEFGVRSQEAAAQHEAQAGHYAAAEKSASAAQALRERHQSFLEKHSPGVRPMNVGVGSQVFDPATGKVLFNNKQAARSALDKTTIGYELPAVEAKDAIPADSGQRSLLGMDWLAKDVAPTPAIPAVTARPAMRVHRPATAADALGVGQPTNEFPVTQPQGVTVRDKASGKTFRYKGNPNEIPQEQYDIVQ